VSYVQVESDHLAPAGGFEVVLRAFNDEASSVLTGLASQTRSSQAPKTVLEGIPRNTVHGQVLTEALQEFNSKQHTYRRATRSLRGSSLMTGGRLRRAYGQQISRLVSAGGPGPPQGSLTVMITTTLGRGSREEAVEVCLGSKHSNGWRAHTLPCPFSPSHA